MPRRFPAAWFDGLRPVRHEVELEPAGRGLRIRRADGTEALWPYGELVLVRAGLASDPLRFERGAEALEVQDHALLDAIAMANPDAAQAFRKPDTLPAYAGKAALATLGVAGFAAVMVLWGVPAFGALVARLVPPAWEADLGKAVSEELVPASERCRDAARTAVVQAMVDRLVAARPRSPYKYRVTLSTAEEVNAFAAPGGWIVVNRGLIAKCGRPEVLAGVLAHEVQHVEQRHATQAICRELTLSTLIGAVTGGGDVARAAGLGALLGKLSYSRQAEEQADVEGLALMRDAGLDPAGMVEAFEMLRDGGPDVPAELAYLSTHPRTEERLARLRALIPTGGRRPAPWRPAMPWARVRAGCE